MAKPREQRVVVSVLIENEAGALSRVVGLFAQRGYNIETLTVAPTQDRTLSRITITLINRPELIEQIVKNLHKIIPVFKVQEVEDPTAWLDRETALIRVHAGKADERSEIERLTKIFGGRIVDVTRNTMVIEQTGPPKKIEALLGAMEKGHVLEVVKSGSVVMLRGDKSPMIGMDS